MTRKMVVLVEGQADPNSAKTAVSVIRYKPEEVVAALDSTTRARTCQELLGVGGELPVVASLAAAPAANTLLIGIAPAGGKVPPEWRAIILEALSRKLNVISGLHDFLGDDPEFSRAAAENGVEIFDVRKNSCREVARRQGLRAECLRLHTVGNDCNVGKMVVSIEITRGLQAAGHDTKFVATGQTGIMIEGDGCPIDCVVADFVNGAAEQLVRDHQHHEILLIEGQGSITHPMYSAVTLGLLHGCLPDGLILCYEVGRRRFRHLDIPLPSLAELKAIYETLATAAHPCKVIGVGMNSRTCSAAEAEAERERVRRELGLPVCDVFRHGPGELVAAVLRLKEKLNKGIGDRG